MGWRVADGIMWCVLACIMVLAVAYEAYGVVLAWEYPFEEKPEAFLLQRKVIGGAYENAAVGIGPYVRALEDRPVPASDSVMYCYQVIATYGAKSSPPSNEVCVTIAGHEKPVLFLAK